jgi:hypothetical protein
MIKLKSAFKHIKKKNFKMYVNFFDLNILNLQIK